MAAIKLSDLLLGNKSLMENNPHLVKEMNEELFNDNNNFKCELSHLKELEKKYNQLKKIAIEISIAYENDQIRIMGRKIKKLNELIKKNEYL